MSRKVPGPCRPHISLRNAIYIGDKYGREKNTEKESSRGTPKRVRKRAQHVFSLSRSFRTAECSRSNTGMTLLFYRIVECRNGRGRERREALWFISFFNNSLLFSSSFDLRGYLLIYRSRHVGDDSFLFTIWRYWAMGFITFSIDLSFFAHALGAFPFLICPAVRNFISLRWNHCRCGGFSRQRSVCAEQPSNSR